MEELFKKKYGISNFIIKRINGLETKIYNEEYVKLLEKTIDIYRDTILTFEKMIEELTISTENCMEDINEENNEFIR